METRSIMLVGVGGQGTLLASRILGNTLLSQGFDVKVSEVHGMSQRGGSVVTYIKYGDKVYSPVIEKGEADIIISFEQLESARWLPYLKKGGVLISSTQKIDPMPVIMGKAEYPQEILSKLAEKDIKPVCLDALSLAIEAGTPKCANIVLLGAAVQFLGIDKEMWVDIIRSTVPPKTIDVNLKAFELGYNAN